MKRRIIPVLAALALLLCGCGRKYEARYESFAESLRERADVTLTAEVRAVYDDRVCEFTLRCTEDDGGFTVEVLAPELIRGVKARVGADGAKLMYDGVSIDTGNDGGTGLTPMGALPQLLRTMRGGWLDSAWAEDGGLAVKLIPEDDIAVTVWFDADMKPLRAELAHGGVTVIFCEIEEFL